MKKTFLCWVSALLILALAVGMAQAGSLQADPMSIPSNSFSLPDGYDPASEEEQTSSYVPTIAYDDYGRARYAGATPIPLYPIDMPTATPKPVIPFSYGDVKVDRLGLSFEAPVGWGIMENAEENSVILTNPTAVDGVNATLTVRLIPVSATFKLTDLRTELKNYLKDLGQYNYSKWSTTEMASRTLLKKDGYYADYEGLYYNGTAVYGRVMMALLDSHQIILLQIHCPDGFFNNSYKAVINHLRDTLKQN